MQDKNLYQSNFMILIASLIGTVLSFKWFMHEYNVVTTLLEADMEVSWFLYLPLMLVIIIIFIISVLLLIGSAIEFKAKNFLNNSNLKSILISTIFINSLVVVSVIVNEYFFKGMRYQYSGIFILAMVVSAYIYLNKKQKIDIFYFITMTTILSALFWGVMYILF